jgi:hypothetical protein
MEIDKRIEKYILIEELFENIDYLRIFQITPYVNNLILTLATLRETEKSFDFSDVIVHIQHLILELQIYQKMLPEGKEWEWEHIDNVIQTLEYDIQKINQSIFSTDISVMMENLDL